MGIQSRFDSWLNKAIGILLIACVSCTSGCSLALFGVGAIHDAAQPEYEELKGKDIETIPDDSEVSVVAVSGVSSKGKFNGIMEEQKAAGTRTGKTPTYLRLKITSGAKDIDMKTIVYVRKKNTCNSKWGLLVAGAAIDAVVVFFMVTILRGLGSSFGE